MNCHDLLREVMGAKNLGQFRDGLIRQMGLPFHWLLPPCSKLHLGLTMPQQPEPPVPCGCNF